MNKVYKIHKVNKKNSQKSQAKNPDSNISEKMLVNLTRYRDKDGLIFSKEYEFLKKYTGCDIFAFKQENLTLIFIKNEELIENYVVYDKTKEYINDKMSIKKFKTSILNDKYKNFKKTFNYSRKYLYRYEIDLLNDINDWLNDSVCDIKSYNILYNFDTK